MKQKLIRLKTSDGLELPGIIYESENEKIVIHVHGLSGNFYENKFLDAMAETYTKLGFSFLVFNNRGSSIINDVSKKILGSAYEIFADSKLDIDAAVNFALLNNYKDIVLQGHSFGCNKVVNYKNDLIKGIILLAPTDVAFLTMQTPNYVEKLKQCYDLIDENKGDSLISGFSQYFSAKTIVENFIENSTSDIFRYRTPTYKCSKLNEINVPVCIFIGDKDNLAMTNTKEEIYSFFKSNINDLDFYFVDDADHSFTRHAEVISENCGYFLNDRLK